MPHLPRGPLRPPSPVRRTGSRQLAAQCNALSAPLWDLLAQVTKPGGQPDPLLWCGLHEGIYNDTAGRKDVLQTVHTTRCAARQGVAAVAGRGRPLWSILVHWPNVPPRLPVFVQLG